MVARHQAAGKGCEERVESVLYGNEYPVRNYGERDACTSTGTQRESAEEFPF